jgi:membrane-associated phospholipid phosphatase
MTRQTAVFFSSFGHPFVLLPLILGFLMAHKTGFQTAFPAFFSIVGCLAAMGLFLYFRKRKGKISNWDVSVREERSRNIYRPILALIGLTSAILYITGQPFVAETLFFGSLMAFCYAVNTKVKISQHTVIACYLSALLLEAGLPWGFGMLVFSALVAWSRVVLGRHEAKEVLLGAAVGVIFGLAQNELLNP